MVYKVYWKTSALIELSKICSSISLPLKARVELYLIKSPQELGKALTSKHKGLYRYRYGDHRIIYEIDRKNKSIVILKVGHRKEIYI